MSRKRYLMRFVNELLDFRLLEFNSLVEMFKLEFEFLEPPSNKPYFLLETTDECKLIQMFQRSVLGINLYEFWACETNLNSFKQKLQICDQILDERYAKSKFRIDVESFGKKISLQSKIDKIEQLDFLPFHGPIDLKNPDFIFHYMEYFGLDGNNVPEYPIQIIFGRWIAESHRKSLAKYSLKHRKFIANTSMDPTLSFLMCNIAGIENNDIVYDPFVGSGSLLVSAANFGAFVLGTDIDYLLLHGSAKPSRFGVKHRDQDESVRANLKQYGLEDRYLDVITGDSSQPLIRNDFQFDAIITDPPYGKRESRQRVGTLKANPSIPIEATHYPSKLEYQIDDIYSDLLRFAAKNLKVGKIILFWAPYSRKPDDQNHHPRLKTYSLIQTKTDADVQNLSELFREKFLHNSLKFIGFAEQQLTCRYSRCLIAMQKI
ncbi:hypothetical protein NH340_JMT05973 [Sarcoptes scabiei]|nr:hypothetical protein NH340_JMT05973 [Sarcoptes scabiei]